MKVFKNPITGEEFEDISVAKRDYCTTHPCTSGGCKFHNVVPEFKKCDEWAAAHPEEAAELMGLVVEEMTILDGERPAPARSKLAEILGVEEDEVWTYPGFLGKYRIHGGIRQYKGGEGSWFNCSNESDLAEFINHPESIVCAPRLTESEIAIMRSVGAKWVSMDAKSCTGLKADLWDVEPYKTPNGVYIVPNADQIARAKIELFPSVKPGDCIGLEEAEK